jgi:hypothetical protein
MLEMLGSCAMIWRYMPTPESSEGTALKVFAFPTLGGPEVTEVFRTLLVGCPPAEPAPALAAAAARVLPSHPGRLDATLVMLPVVIFESTVLTRFRLAMVGLAAVPVRRLSGLFEPTTLPSLLGSGLRNRPPNLDSFSD